MTTWTGYFGIENLALNAAQKLTLVDTLKALGSPSHPIPNLQMQWRVRNDGNAVIFEAEFKRTQLDTDWFINGLATIFGVNPNKITADVINVSFERPAYVAPTEPIIDDDGKIVEPPEPIVYPTPTPVATFSFNSTPMLSMALFGGINATWEESWRECTAYLAKNQAKWER